MGREALFFNDNASTVISFKKGYSRDPWTSSIVRAARELAAALGASLFVEWERRRSSYGSEVADDLTHNLLGNLSEEELISYLSLGITSFPRPILEWMGAPRSDRSLGTRVIRWILLEYPALNVLFK